MISENKNTGLPAEARSDSRDAKAGPKDVFLHILSVVALYVAVGSFVALVFQYINLWIPDPLEAGYIYILSIYDSIRWSIAILIIVFPVYVWSIWFLNRGYASFPERREMKSRKWLIYFTLFAAALIIIGDLVALVYNLLRGEFTSRFLLKVFIVLLVAGSVFIYYLWEVRRRSGLAKPWHIQAVTYISILAVALSIVGGFFVVGSPTEERAYRFDDERVRDLQMIQGEILNFWKAKERLPENLSELKDEFSGFAPPPDPETGASYVYQKTANLKFELCANFNRPNREPGTPGAKPAMLLEPPFPYPGTDGTDNWQHETGEICFSRTIDPERYPPFEKPTR